MEPSSNNPGGGGGHHRALYRHRRKLRHRVQTPAYVSVDTGLGKAALDPNQVLNISEDGMCIQSAGPLPTGRLVSLCLDLFGLRSPIRTTGHVVWSSPQGRTGIFLAGLAESARHQIQEWLFFNILSANANASRARTEEILPAEPDPPAESGPSSIDGAGIELEPVVPPDYTQVLAGLTAVRREVEMLGPKLESALQLVAGRALAFTGATGAAIALLDREGMTCRAAAGRDAPPVGTLVDAESGFSGECIRTARALYCKDSETDPRVDREICRELGVRSIAALPIATANRVAGLIEVFSPKPNAFGSETRLILQNLADTVPPAINRAARALLQERSYPLPAAETSPAYDRDDSYQVMTGIGSPGSPRWLLVAVGVTLALILSWLTVPWKGLGAGGTKHGTPMAQNRPIPTSNSVAETTADLGMDGLRRLAAQGDPVAEFALGRHYATGDGVSQDYSQASRWFTLAAEQGHVLAQETLGAYYWAGRGVPQDLVKAYFWSVLAQAGGDESSKYRVSILASRMTRSQVLAAQQEANQWLRQHQVVPNNSTQSP
jgi:hypothetical protein